MDSYNNEEILQRASTPSEEIETLRAQAIERGKSFGLEELSRAELERIASHEIVDYGDKTPEQVLDPDFQMENSEIEEKVLGLNIEQEGQINELVGMLAEKGIKNTLSVVEKLNNPHLADDFHKFLVQYLAEGVDVRGLKEGTPLFKALHMNLFEVTLPDVISEGSEGNDRSFASLVAAMEQFYSGMLSIKEPSHIKSYFTLEIALSSSNDDVVFYMAIPAKKTDLFEKQLNSTFPNANITLHKEDYNPFGKGGFAAASIAKLDKVGVLPLRTYDKFEQDPLNIILGVFSKLKREGEGAAIQFIIAPAGDKINSKYREVLKEVKKGTSLNRAMESATIKISREWLGATKTVLFGGGSKKDESLPTDQLTQTGGFAGSDFEVDETEVQAITEKISSPVINVNLRIIGSAETQERAKEIMSDLESAFNQFTNEPSNRIAFRHVNSSGLKQLLHEFSFRLFSKKHVMTLNLKEVTTMFHLPVSKVNAPQLKQSKLVSAPAPIGMTENGVFLGVNQHRGVETNIYMPSEDRMRHFYCIGQTGTGKTTLLKNMIIQDIKNGEGVCYIDPHGTDIEDVLNAIPENRIKDVIYFDPSDVTRPMGLNILEYDPTHPEQKSFVINEILSIFNKLFDMKVAGGPMFEQYFRNATSLVIDDPDSGNTLLDVSRVLADQKFRELKLSRCKNPIVVQFWREIASKAGGESSLANMVPYITNKFDVFLSNETMRLIVSQEKSAFNFRNVMDERKILLVNLAKGRLGDINSHLIGLILVGKILMAALSRVDSVNRKPPDFYLYIDEFQNITTDSISAILSEARKYRLGLNIAHQFIAQLDDDIKNAVFGNVGSIAAFRVGAEDAEFLESQFAPTITTADIMKIPNHNAYVKMLIDGFPTKPFNIELERPVVGSPEIGVLVKQYSRDTYGRDREELDREVMEKYKKTDSTSNRPIEKRTLVNRTQPLTQTQHPPVQTQTPSQSPQTPVQTPVQTQTIQQPIPVDSQTYKDSLVQSRPPQLSRPTLDKDSILLNRSPSISVSPLLKQKIQPKEPVKEVGTVSVPKYGFDKKVEYNELKNSLDKNTIGASVQSTSSPQIFPEDVQKEIKPVSFDTEDLQPEQKIVTPTDVNLDRYRESVD